MATINCTPRTQNQTRNFIFDDIGIGVIFRTTYQDKNDIYIRIDSSVYDGEYNAIHLMTGEGDYFKRDEEIEIINRISYSEDDVESTTPVFE